jgi:hypothetical protein
MYYRNTTNTDLNIYQEFAAGVSAFIKGDPKIKGKGKLGNIVRMKIISKLYNNVLLPFLFPENPDYKWELDASNVKTNKDFKALLEQRYKAQTAENAETMAQLLTSNYPAIKAEAKREANSEQEMVVDL